MKAIALGIMALFVLGMFVSAQLAPTKTPITATVSDGSGSSSHSNGGGHSKCLTQWGWDGEKYIKRDVVVKQKLYKGTTLRLTNNVQIAEVRADGTMLNIIRDGDTCRTLTPAPMMSGATTDITPLPLNWYRK